MVRVVNVSKVDADRRCTRLPPLDRAVDRELTLTMSLRTLRRHHRRRRSIDRYFRRLSKNNVISNSQRKLKDT